jgi:hypothetical protein
MHARISAKEVFKGCEEWEKLVNKNAVYRTILLFLLTNMLLSTFIIRQVRAREIALLSPQNIIYTVNASIPLTFTVYEFNSWIGYSLNGQPNVTITGNTTLPTLPDGCHYLVIYANDTFGNMKASPTQHFTVDTTAPTGSIMINDGAASTISLQVTLTLSAEDATSGVAQMRFFEAVWAEWEEYATSKLWEFKAGGGYMTVYVQFMDNAGLVSAPYPATIYLGDTPPPSDPPVTRAPVAQPTEEVTEPESTQPEPTEPQEVTEPEEPEEPNELVPTEPEPTEPEEPTEEPTEPEEPEEPTEPEPAEPTEAPLFSTTDLAIIAAVAVAVVIGIAAYWQLRKRK